MSDSSPQTQSLAPQPQQPPSPRGRAPGGASLRRERFERRRGLLVFLGENPFLAVAMFVHVIFVIAFYPMVFQEEEEPEPPERSLPIIGMTTLEDASQANDDDDAEESQEEDGGAEEQMPEVATNPALEPQEVQDEPEPAEQATSPRPRDPTLPDPTRSRSAPQYAAEASEALAGLLTGERTDGGEGSGSVRGGQYALRSERGRAVGTREHGGSEGSEAAVDAGLHWLAHHQYQAMLDLEVITPDEHAVVQVPLGYWRPHGFHHDARDLVTGEPVRTSEIHRGSLATTDSFVVGNTALALLAFLGAGHTHQSESEYQDVVARTVRWLSLQQAPSGMFGHIHIRNHHLRLDQRRPGAYLPAESQYGRPNLYNHSLALFALAECLAMTGDETLRPIVRQGVAYVVQSQNRNGGWDYHPNVERNDSSITTWVLLALRAADAAGVEVPRTTYLRIIHHFQRLTPADGRTYYNDRLGHLTGGADAQASGNTGQGIGMIASSLLTRLLLGAAHDDPMVQRQVQLIGQEPPDTQQRTDEQFRPNMTNPTQNYYAWYKSTLALFLYGGSEWTRWNSVARDTIIRAQSRTGQLRGSWDTQSRFAGAGGRIYTTAIMVLTLQVYYRYSPNHLRAEGRLYERFWDDDELYAVLGESMRTSRNFIRRHQ